ncbi:breast cancer 2 susceptibility protein [Entomortierella parvispora]|uniref:Breast cancer 2 susceptibility protein n=1 Tax=Entomortierella parvispora TaxID=205924 RepID=A0A9P3H3B6_9FUNG|nr:breast cancer 2 susceptibility protein [Entomortierella parvispora]
MSGHESKPTLPRSTIRTAVCPGHLIGHPTVVMTQSRPLSPPLAPSDSASFHTEAGNESTFLSGRRTTSSCDDAFEAKLWSMVPASFLPPPATPSTTGSVVQRASSQRPTLDDTMDRSEWLSSRQERADPSSPREALSKLSLSREMNPLATQSSLPRKRRSSSPLDISQRSQPRHVVPTPRSAVPCPRELPTDEDSPFSVTEATRPNLFSPPNGNFFRRHRASTSVATSRDQIRETVPTPFLLRCQSWDPDIPTRSPTDRRANRSFTPTNFSKDGSPELPIGGALGGGRSSAHLTRILEPLPPELWRIDDQTMLTGASSPGENVLGPPTLIRTDGEGLLTDKPVLKSSPVLPESDSSEEAGLASPSNQQEAIAEVRGIFRTPTKKSSHRHPTSPVIARASGSESSSRRSSLTDLNPSTPMPRTPITNISRHRMSLNGDASKSSDQGSSILTSPSVGIQWSPSMETPVKKRTSTGPLRTPIDNLRMKLQGIPPQGAAESPLDVADCDGWSTNLETPPRKVVGGSAERSETLVDDSVLAKLRGAPHASPPLRERRRSSSSSVEGSFYSATSSLNDRVADYQLAEGAGQERTEIIIAHKSPTLPIKEEEVERSQLLEDGHVNSWATADLNIKPEDMGVAILSVPSVPLIDTDLTLPMSFLQEIQDPESPILQSTQASDSGLLYDDHLDGISSSALDKALRSKSNESSAYATQSRRDSRSQRSNRDGGPYSRDSLKKGTYSSHSQDLLPENLPLDEPWILSSPVMDDHDMDIDVKIEDVGVGPNGLYVDMQTRGDTAAIEDDFDNIAFSQLDDGFNIMEPTQGPPPQRRKSHGHTKEALVGQPAIQEIAATAKPRTADEVDWLSASNAMLGDMLLPRRNDLMSDHAESSAEVPRQPPPSLTGFASASGKKLKPVSKDTLAKFARLLDDNGGSGETGMVESEDCATNRQPPVMTGFSSGAGRKLAPISKDALKKAAGLFDDVEHDIDPMNIVTGVQGALRDVIPPMVGFASAGGKNLAPLSKEAQERARRLFEDEMPWTSGCSDTVSTEREPVLGGFASGTGRKLAPVSISSVEKWSKTLDLDSAPAPSIHSAGGFSSGKGNPLAPISESARGRALGLLEMEHPPVSVVSVRDSGAMPLAGKNSIHPSIQGPKPGQTAGQDSQVPRQSAVSANMANLMMKSLRANSAGKSSLPGVLKPKSKLPFKSPMPFKSPLNSGTVAALAHGNPSGKSAVPTTVTTPKKFVGKKALHPNAKPNLVSPAPNVLKEMPVCSFQSLFNLTASGERTSLHGTLSAPKRRETEELLSLGVPKDALDMTLSKAKVYRFSEWGPEQALDELLRRGAAPDLVSLKWVQNHYGLIVWKLACYVRSWPENFPSAEWFCPEKILDQLAYRYEREINRAERPALRKIVEGDDSASRHMVLCIADISSGSSEETQKDSLQVTVTDGWYVLSAMVDPTLVRSIERGRLGIGSKIHVCRAKLNGAENGAAILELMEGSSSSVSLALQANHTRLARWDAKLGFQPFPLLWTKRLKSITPEGGLVPGLDVVVLRKYPVVYLETLTDGITKIKRTAREEDRAAEAHQESLQTRYQQIVQDVEKEFGDNNVDSETIRLEVESRAQELQSEAARNVTPMFTIRVGNYDVHGDRDHEEEALVTFWNNVHAPYREGHRVRITSLIAKKRSRELGFEDIIQLVGTRQTTVHDMAADTETMTLTHYQPRTVTLCADVGQLYFGAEMDLAVVVLASSEVAGGSNNKQYAVVTDSSLRLLLVEHQGPSSNNPSSTPFKVTSKILITNARYKSHDGKLGLDIVSCPQNYTQLTATQGTSSSNWPTYAETALQRLAALVPGQAPKQGRGQEQQTIGDLMAQANVILTTMHPSL